MFISIMVDHSSGSPFSVPAVETPIPALANAASSRPNFLSPFVTTFSSSVKSVASAGTLSALSSPNDSTSSANLSSLLAVRMTLWPLLTNVFALASPMPLEAPVIRTTFSFAMIISPMFTYSK